MSGLLSFEQTAAVAQLVERVLGKDEVTGSNPVSSFVVACRRCGKSVFGASAVRVLWESLSGSDRWREPGEDFGAELTRKWPW